MQMTILYYFVYAFTTLEYACRYMCKALAELLGNTDPLFTVGIKQLEIASGNSGNDVKLYAEIIRKSHQKMRELGLDPRDTTPEELYHALLGLIKKHDEFLAKRLGADDPADVQDILPRIVTFINKLDTPKSVWALKPVSAKRMLKLTPPRKVMKQLGYRSIDSMLRREPVTELYVALRFVESQEWLQNFTRKYKHLSASDFEMRQVQFIQLDAKKWGVTAEAYAKKQRHNVTHMKEMGVIALLPLPIKRLPGITVAVLPLLLHYLNEVRMYSTYFKMQQVRSDFGSAIAETLIYDPRNHAKVAGHEVHWRTVQRHLGKNSTHIPDFFEPHVHAEDLFWRKAEEILYRIEPALHFWNDVDYVAIKTKDGVVGFCLMDAAVNFVNQLPFGNHVIHQFRASLWSELFVRYIGQPALEYQVFQQLSQDASRVAGTENIYDQMFL